MKYTQKTINHIINDLSKHHNITDDNDIRLLRKQLDWLVEAVVFDFKNEIQQLTINTNNYENRN